MPVYECKCCQIATSIKGQYDAHLLTKKHLKLMECQTENKDTSKLEEKLANHELSIANLTAEIVMLKSALQECKEMFMMKNTAPPTQIIHLTPPPSPLPIIAQEPIVEQPKKETCNPVYIAKQMDEDPSNNLIPVFSQYFSIKTDNVMFDFSDIDELKDVAKGYVVDKLVAYVKENKATLPFKYYKSSWYIKRDNGLWERDEPDNNKSCNPTSDTYKHSPIVKSLLFIFQNRFIKYFDELKGVEWRNYGETEFTRLVSECFSREVYRNSELAAPYCGMS
jgi:hypothetical protein